MKAYAPHKILLFLLSLLIGVASCKKDPEPEPEPDPGLPQETLILNNWIWEGLHELYLWEEFLPNMDPDYEEDSKVYFYKLLTKDDNDSWITDDYEALVDGLEGVELTTGMSAAPGLFGENAVISIVEYVTPETPAADSGIVRGDIIITIDGISLNKDNYFDLYYQTTATFGFGTWNGVDVIPNGKEITLTAEELNQNPFVYRETIEYQGYKIGYCVYTSFVPGPENEWMDEINEVFGEFKTAGVSDVVIDLRYNAGGYGYVAEQMASVLGPETAVSNHRVFSTQIWNSRLTEYWKNADLNSDGKADGDESERLLSRFPDTEINLNLSKLYFLTTGRTASSSELLMVGLYPYADVVQIGTPTYGKCYGSVTVDDYATPKRHNWAMQPIVIKYANSEGYTDFVEGIPPDFEVVEYLLEIEPFGSTADPMLAKALEEISGVAPAMKKSGAAVKALKALPVPRKQIPELKLEWLERPGVLELN
jgi:carboxyl-terminal processing protease